MGVVGLYKISQREWNGEKGLGKKIFKKEGHIGNLRFNKKTHKFVNNITCSFFRSYFTTDLYCKMKLYNAIKTRKITKQGTVHASLLLPTTSWKRYYLHTGNVILNGFLT